MAARKTRSVATTGSRAEVLATRPTELIQGIRLHVSGIELATRLEQRIRWHRERNDALLTQMKKLAEVERDAGNEMRNTIGRYDSPQMVLEKKAHDHQDRAGFLAFVRDHLVKDATYRLDSIDLRMIEILPERGL